MHTSLARLLPLSAFGTLPKGDSLFGQLCWAARHRFGESRLTEWLDGYTDGAPFLVVSDALPAGHLPRPALPGHWFDEVENADRKAVKKRRWLPLDRAGEPLAAWLRHCVGDAELVKNPPGEHKTTDKPLRFLESHPQPHNSLSRATGTTGRGAFAPYQMEQHWYAPGTELDLWLVHDPARIGRDDLALLLADIGAFGFGRDASIGLGKFKVVSVEAVELPTQPRADAWLTLAPCAPQGLAWRPESCFYQPFTRFGRHGDLAVQSGRPFKNPILLAQTGALLAPHSFEPRPFVGQGLGGAGQLSKAIAATVHQGYAPVVAVALPTRETAA
jgi:CRISPR-associated protein Csm4